MGKQMFLMVVAVVLNIVILGVVPADARNGKGKPEKDLMSVKIKVDDEKKQKQIEDTKTPPGWSKGKKKGWKGGSVPPGLNKEKETDSGKNIEIKIENKQIKTGTKKNK